MNPLVLRRWAVSAQFLCLGLTAGAWGAHVPSLKSTYNLDEMGLAAALLSISLGSIVSFIMAGRWIGRWGATPVMGVCGLGIALGLAAVLWWPLWALLLASLVLVGMCMGVLDVAINSEATQVEAGLTRPLMGQMHGFFSLGGMLGASAVAGMWTLGWPAPVQLVVAAALVLLGSSGNAWGMQRWVMHEGADTKTPDAEAAAQEKPQLFVWPRGPLLLMGLLVLAGGMSEGVMYDWSVLYLQQELGAPASTAAYGYAVFMGAMAAARFGGDALRRRIAAPQLLRYGGTLAAVGMAITLASGTLGHGLLADAGPHPAVLAGSLLGYALVGVGLAMVVPIVYHLASQVKGVSPAAAIAAVASIGYFGFLAGPPLIGFIASHWSLSGGLAMVMVGGTLVALGSRRLKATARD